MIKFMHAADLHLDSAFAALAPEQAAQRRQEQRQLLEAISALCRKQQCQVLLLAGDLFDGAGVYRDTLDALRQALADCGARVFIAPGNHDYICPNSPYLTQAWPDNVHIFTRPEPEMVLLEELGCAVYGAAFTAASMPAMLPGFHVRPEERSLTNLMVLHGDTQTPDSVYNPITRHQITLTGLDYLALGHIHKPSDLYTTGKTRFAWPGCPMGRGFDETGARGVFVGTAEPGRVDCRFLPLPGRRYEIVEVEAGDDPLAAALAALPEQTERDIYRIIFTGEAEELDLNRLYEQLSGRFYALQLRDRTVPPLELWTRCGEDTLPGLYLQWLHDALDACKSDYERRCVEQAARRGLQVMEGREVTLP